MKKISITASITANGSGENVQHGTITVEGVHYDYVYDFDAVQVHIDGGIRAGENYRMEHLAHEETTPLLPRILARGILHHYKNES